MGPEGVVLQAPAVGQALSLGHRGEKLGVQEFIPESTVERFGKTVLPRGSWLDVGGGGAAGLAPALEGVGEELGAVVGPDVSRRRIEAHEFLQYGHHVLGLAAPAHPDIQTEAAVLVDHVHELQPTPIGGGVKLEFHRPDLMRVFGLVAPHRTIGATGPLLLSRNGPLQSLLPPEPMDPLVVHQPALAPQQAVGHPPAPADVLSGDLPEATPEFGLLDIDDPATMALGAAVLAHHAAGKPLGNPEHGAQGREGPARHVSGSEVSLGQLLEHRFLQLGFYQKLFAAGILFVQLGQAPGLLGLHATVLLLPAVIGRRQQYGGMQAERHFRDEFLNTELFTRAPEARILADRWRWEYNSLRLHSALEGRTPLDAVQQKAAA